MSARTAFLLLWSFWWANSRVAREASVQIFASSTNNVVRNRKAVHSPPPLADSYSNQYPEFHGKWDSGYRDFFNDGPQRCLHGASVKYQMGGSKVALWNYVSTFHPYWFFCDRFTIDIHRLHVFVLNSILEFDGINDVVLSWYGLSFLIHSVDRIKTSDALVCVSFTLCCTWSSKHVARPMIF